MLTQLAAWLPAVVMALCTVLPALRGSPGYSLFLQGARQGALAALQALPALLAMSCCMAVWGATGLGGLLLAWVGQGLAALSIPPQSLTVLLLRPLSGGGGLGALGQVLAACGADSYAGRLASVWMGGGEVFVYTATVYYTSAKQPMGRGMLPLAFGIHLATAAFGAVLCSLFW